MRKQSLLNACYATIQTLELSRMVETTQIPLSKGYEAIVDEIDADLAVFKWYGQRNQDGGVYARRYFTADEKPASESMHRVVLARILGRLLTETEEVDHINRNSLDNTRRNLRLATPSQNCRNRKVRADSLSGIKGVLWRGGKKPWVATVWRNRKQIYYERFVNLRDAVIAYNEAALKYFGDFALLNEVPPIDEPKL